MQVHTYGKPLDEIFIDRLFQLLEADVLYDEELEELDHLHKYNNVYMDYLLEEDELIEFYKSRGVEFVWD